MRSNALQSKSSGRSSKVKPWYPCPKVTESVAVSMFFAPSTGGPSPVDWASDEKAFSHCVFLAAFALASMASPAANMVVYTKVDVGVPIARVRRRAVCPLRLARAPVLETHEMHLQVPGFDVARDQMARIATGACCAKSGGATKDRVAGGRTRRRTVVGAMVLLRVGSYESPAGGWRPNECDWRL